MNIQDKKGSFLHKRDGTGQQDRLLPKLINNHRLIDNKTLDEHIVFLYLYSDLLQYYNNQNEPVNYNAWRNFLEYDDTVIASLILHSQIEPLKAIITNAFLALKGSNQIHTENKYTKQLIDILEELIVLINYWYARLPNNNTLQVEIYSFVTQEFSQLITNLYSLLKQWDSQYDTDAFADFNAFIAHTWDQLEPWNQISFNKTEPAAAQDATIAEEVHTILRDLFSLLFNHINTLKKLAKNTYQSTLKNERHHPQTALMIAFLRLLEYATAHMNYLPQRHLDHYYSDVLKFRAKPVQPDKTYVHFHLKSPHTTYTLPQGTQLIAGKDPAGENIIFETDKTITVNQGTISKIHTFQRAIQRYQTQDNLPVVNVAIATYDMDEVYQKQVKLNLFAPRTAQPTALKQVTTGQPLGLMITSSVLYLQEGKREIELAFKFTDAAFKQLLQRVKQLINQQPASLYETLAALFNQAITIEVTTADAWVALPANSVKFIIKQDANCLKMLLTVMPDIPPIVGYDCKVHGDIADIDTPSIRMIAKDDAHLAHIYLFRELALEKLDIQVQVHDYRGLILQNDLGLIDASKPFQPFGAFPKLHANLYMGSEEVFSKNLKDLKINIEWEGLPKVAGGFKTYYQAYPHRITNAAFRFNVAYLKHRQWQPFYAANRQEIPLFEVEKSDDQQQERLSNKRTIDNIDRDRLGFDQELYKLNPPIWTPKTLTGFLKLELSGPNMAFGHSLYPKLAAQSFLEQAKSKLAADANPLNEPYTPTIKSLSLAYTAKDEIIFSNQSTSNKASSTKKGYIKLFPFGYRVEYPNRHMSKVTFLPDTDQGEHFLSLGIKNFNASLLRLHIEVDETSIDPDKDFIKPTWRCLSNNIWVDFTTKEIVSDTTEGLTKSGIIVLSVPATVNRTNTLMAPGLTWIKAMFPASVSSLPTILGIYTQAVAATRQINPQTKGNQPSKLAPYNIAGIISNPVAIASVTQPFASFGGRPAENQVQLYTRISERLKHKNRAIAVWDYERIVLEQFPEILKVKCINHTQKQENFQVKPGAITVVVIKAHQHKHSKKRLLPIASKQLLESIKHALQKVASPFVKLAIVNPVYEEIQVNLEVKFKPGYEKGVLLNRLQRDIKHFLSPWLLNKAEEVKLGGTIPSSQIMDFISQSAYIAAIGNFSILKYTHQEQGTVITKVTDYNNYLMASYPWSVMVSSEKHKISVVEELDPNSHLRHGGVDDMRLGTDFIIGPWQGVPAKAWEQENQEETIKESLEPYYLITKKHINP